MDMSMSHMSHKSFAASTTSKFFKKVPNTSSQVAIRVSPKMMQLSKLNTSSNTNGGHDQKLSKSDPVTNEKGYTDNRSNIDTRSVPNNKNFSDPYGSTNSNDSPSKRSPNVNAEHGSGNISREKIL